jgi:competence protein ComEC
MLGFVALGHGLADLGIVLRTTVDPFSCLAASAACVLLARPGSLLDAGFQLSYAATAAILVWARGSRKVGRPASRGAGWRQAVERARASLGVSVAAHLATAPLVALHFGTYHPAVIAANLVTIPLVTVALWLDVGLLVVAATPLAGLAVRPLAAVLSALQGAMEALARLPAVQLPAGTSLGWWLVGLGTLALGLHRVTRPGGRGTGCR